MTSDRLYPSRPLLAASVAVIRDGRILLAARGKPPCEGLYSLPGGMVETGESLGEAALRELREEVGVEAELIGMIAPVEFIERDAQGHIKHHVVIAAHAARWVSGEPQTGPEAKDIRWVTERDIVDLPMTAGLSSILEQAFRIARERARP
ncbi:NUDIX domain-containing protein [Microvirga makkahensis]|uniref:NUDIX domain-containing protein n=1 Tax=Microvirga makkahensis TaxID=1128670 RepID=A0A7X3SQ65_9HYPH|nr:NUDIX domain-containing protein [Microvirga makkahensis]